MKEKPTEKVLARRPPTATVEVGPCLLAFEVPAAQLECQVIALFPFIQMIYFLTSDFLNASVEGFSSVIVL